MSQIENLVDAIDTFIVGCKADNTWDAIKACCIMAAWDGLNGALVPLKGDAPTNFNFVSGDYNRKTGLVGDGSTKCLDSNRNNNADPQDNKHMSVYVASINTTGGTVGLISTNGFSAGHSCILDVTGGDIFSRLNCETPTNHGSSATGFIGISRPTSSSYTARLSQVSSPVNVSSDARVDSPIEVFRRNISPPECTNARISFYSIGESLDLALLSARVSTLMTAIDGAIA